jgi:hypothetical protein
MKFIYLIVVVILFLTACSAVRESAGVNRKAIDEFVVIENPPLIIPPDFNILPPDQLEEKNIEDLEKDLAQEILFGSDQDQPKKTNPTSTMSKILDYANATDTSSSIREELDKQFSQEIKTKSIFQFEFENEIEILDAIKESERIRASNFEGQSLGKGEVPITTQTIKKKKKKRFILF